MSDNKPGGVPFAADNDREQETWASLDSLPRAEPSPNLRRSFYYRLDQAARPGGWQRLGAALGFGAATGWLSAAACGIAGVIAGYLLASPAAGDAARLAALEQNVRSLNRSLILDRIGHASAATRLSAVVGAVDAARDDSEIARALLAIAAGDRVIAVRSAAIDALGPQLATPTVGRELMEMLADGESPLVQLALIDLVLRYGNAAQLQQLLDIAERGLLYPELDGHVRESITRETI